MKQKKGNVSLKAALNGSKNDSIVKNPKNLGAKNSLKGTPSKLTPKKVGKTPVKVVPPKEVDDEEDDESEDEEDSGADVAAGIVDEADGSDAEEEEDDSDDGDDDEDVDGNEGIEEAEDDGEESADGDEDDEPVEEPIGKKSVELAATPKKSKKLKAGSEIGVPKIRTSALPKSFPKDQVLIVRNLPKNYKQIDLVEVFAKFGTLHTIYNIHGPVSSIAYVAYNSPEEAEAAQLATNKVANVKGAIIKVTIQEPNPKTIKQYMDNKQKLAEEKKAAYEEQKRKFEENKFRTVYIKNLKQNTTEEKVREHFMKCGDIESLKVFTRPQHSYGFISFKDESSIPAALNLHNSILDGINIWVVKSDQSIKDTPKDPQRTVLLKNKQNLDSVEVEKLESIFSKCGDIENVSVLCKKNVLAFVTFKESKGAKKALKLNGTTSQGLELEIEEYKVIAPKNKTAVFIQNVKSGVTEEDIRELFASAGPIESVTVNNNGFAIVKFEDTDGFCKSFTLNESILHGNMIFIEPYSDKKQLVLRKNHPKSNRKRPAPFQRGGYGKRMRAN